jgi:hypothetical protein
MNYEIPIEVMMGILAVFDALIYQPGIVAGFSA